MEQKIIEQFLLCELDTRLTNKSYIHGSYSRIL